MGTGASSSSSRSPSPEMQRNNRLAHNEHRKNSFANGGGRDKWKGHNVVHNDVAPIIITKDCFEEYQCTFLAQKEVTVKGSIKEGLMDHILVQGKYFMVADQFDGIDKLKTIKKYGAPNFRRAAGGFSVFGLGQPTGLGLAKVMDFLGQEGCSELIVVCIREEPVLYLKRSEDFVSYTPRLKETLCENISISGATSVDITNEEVALRKEIVRHTLWDESNHFCFYDNITELDNEPHLYHIDYEEHLKTIEEMYAMHTVSHTNARYLRMPMREDGAPDEQVLDAFFNILKDAPTLFDNQDTSTPGLVFVGHIGASRTSYAMVLGMLVLAHKHGFPETAFHETTPINEKEPNLGQGEFPVVQQLCQSLPDGLQIKQEVDVLIDLCDDMSNIRSDIYECKQKMEAITTDYKIDGGSAKQYFCKKMFKYLERYCYAIIFNCYLHQQKVKMFCQSFQAWMQQHPVLYRILGNIVSSGKHSTNAAHITNGDRVLVADDYLGLDVLSSHRDVKVPNFRRVPGLPVFGMAQPGREGLARIVEFLSDEKHSYSSVHVLTLRGEMVLECDGATYTPRKVTSLSDNMFTPGITLEELEDKELQLKNELLKLTGPIQVYEDITEPPKSKQLTSILTLREMYTQQQKITPWLHFHRVPASEYEGSPSESVFEFLVAIVKDLEDIYTDEDGPALVFNCDSGKERTTIGIAAAGLVIWHQKGFPVGVKLEEQERISIPQAEYTKGEFDVVMNLVRRLPQGAQVKREVDLILDKCSETMTPMHFHLRETIFSTYNKMKAAKDEAIASMLRQQSFIYVECYIYLILFNSYLHLERANNWTRPFSKWMVETGRKVGAHETLDNLNFHDLDEDDAHIVSTMRHRWASIGKNLSFKESVD